MNVDKIELLVDKIDKAVKTIQCLKNENSAYKKKVAELEGQIADLQQKNENQQKEISQSDRLHDKLEKKIEEILACLPDDNVPFMEAKKKVEPQPENIIDDALETLDQEEDDEEERIKKFVNEEDAQESQNLFTSESDEDEDLDLEESNVALSSDGDNEEFELNFQDTLIHDESDDVDFHFENTEDMQTTDDLPRGVL